MDTIQRSIRRLNNLSWTHVIILGLFLGGGYVAWDRYQDQLFSFLPYLILLACPLMHILMHRGHGGHGNDCDSDQQTESEFLPAVD